MNRILIAVLMCIVVISACSQSEKASTPAPPAGIGSTSLSPSTGAAPDIISASLYPENPTTATKLIAHYTLRNPGISGITLVFRWFVDNVQVQESAVAELEPGKYGKSSEVYAEIMPSNQFGASRPIKTNVLTIGNLPPMVSSISLTPVDPPVGAIITATAAGEDPDGDTVTLTYQWYVNGKPDTDPRKDNEFNTAGLRKKDLLFVVVAPSDGTTDGKDKESDIMVIADSAPQITSTPQYTIQNGLYQYQMTAKDLDGDTLTYGLLKSPPGMTIDSSNGLISWQVPDRVTEKQEIAIKISADDADGGTAYQEYSFFLEPK
ncbi:MAG: putative Ig domain-containing protein [Nitrospirae bacterium]|nr:putative Ig domain-containing protein [Nitrospirota bacterium]